MIVALFVTNGSGDKIAQTDLFQKQMKKIYAAEMSEAIGIEFYLHFFSAVSHTEKVYIMDGFSANAACF